jgi:hypothetical protein
MIILALAVLPLGTAAAEVQQVVAEIPGNEAFEAPEALQTLDEGPVWLDLTLSPENDPSLRQADGTWAPLGTCDFGPVEAREISVPTGSVHMLLDIRMGNPDQHAANLLSCNYAPDLITDDGLGHRTRVTGCYYAHSVSIPTAVQWVLNPLPAEACGNGD